MVNVIWNPYIHFGSIIAAADEKLIVSPVESFPSVTQEKRLTVADEMNVYETSIWIWTLGYNLGWRDAHVYGKSFLDNDITGIMLPMLSLSMLEEYLGIQNRNHRITIRRAIDIIFPKTNKNHRRVPRGMGIGAERPGSGISMDELTATNSSTNVSSVDYMVESLFSTGVGSSIEDERSSTVSRSRCLLLTLSPEQRVPVGEKDHLKSIFAKFNYNIELTIGEKHNSYILIFDDEDMALKANAQSDELGFKLVKYRAKRPSNDNPVMFKTLYPVQVRDGKSFRRPEIGMLQKDAIVLVNQQKGRRARVIYFWDRESGGWVTLKGWVSLHSETGIQLLNRLEYANTSYVPEGCHYKN